MFSLEGLGRIRKIKWKHLKPGMVVLGGITINDIVPPELRDFPSLSAEDLEDLFYKYRFLENREVLVAEAVLGFDPQMLSRQLGDAAEDIKRINRFRRDFFTEKQKLIDQFGLAVNIEDSLLRSEQVERNYLIKDRFTSFTLPFPELPEDPEIPSFFHQALTDATIGDLLAGKLKEKFRFPQDQEVFLHLVMDYSYSMEQADRFNLAVRAMNSLHDTITSTLENARVQLYAFSNICKPVDYPLTGREVKKEDTYYGSFMKKVLHFNDKSVHNKIILFTDGEPSDRPEALRLAELIKKNKMDFTQIVFGFESDVIEFSSDKKQTVEMRDGLVVTESLPEEALARVLKGEELDAWKDRTFNGFTGIAEAAGGNQIIIKLYEMFKLIAVEVYDRYMGLLTLATEDEIERYGSSDSKNAGVGGDRGDKERREGGPSSGEPKKWEFPKLS